MCVWIDTKKESSQTLKRNLFFLIFFILIFCKSLKGTRENKICEIKPQTLNMKEYLYILKTPRFILESVPDTHEEWRKRFSGVIWRQPPIIRG
jgi:hypothetical protein